MQTAKVLAESSGKGLKPPRSIEPKETTHRHDRLLTLIKHRGMFREKQLKSWMLEVERYSGSEKKEMENARTEEISRGNVINVW